MFLNMISAITLLAVLQVVSGAPVDTPLDTTLILVSSVQQLGSLHITQCPLNSSCYSPPLDETTPERLSSPSIGLSLKYIVLGRGTQNYTCQTETPEAAPVSNGAEATLFDASCLIENYNDLLGGLPNALLHVPHDAAVLAALTLDQLSKFRNASLVVGHHYFSNSTTPFFDFRPSGHADWVSAKSEEKVPAPTDTSANGSVPWLKLGYRDGVGIKEVYRLVTAGGSSPTTCQGQPQAIEVDYAAEYWFYG